MDQRKNSRLSDSDYVRPHVSLCIGSDKWGTKGAVDIPLLSGIGLLGGAMLRDFAIIATGFGVKLDELKKSGMSGVTALILGVVMSFVSGAAIAMAFGYTDAVSITTIGAGAVTYIVGPVTGAALGASSEVMALSIAAGLVKSILVMILTPLSRHISA